MDAVGSDGSGSIRDLLGKGMGAGVLADGADTVCVKGVGILGYTLAFHFAVGNMADLPVGCGIVIPSLGQVLADVRNFGGLFSKRCDLRNNLRNNLRHNLGGALNFSCERLEGECGNQQDCYQQQAEQLFANCFHMFFLLKMFYKLRPDNCTCWYTLRRSDLYAYYI